ncbi:DNA repair protein RecO [Candidatus Saccharibacteria bacterium]|nr:MAG: DNA repair protein RecO [Candidatus Saccharibacteria bacterium]
MNQRRTTAIVLTRVNYGEADRIITVLTPDSGKLSLIAKGVRKVRSKLAGGIELFSTSEITYIPGRGNISTLVSARLSRHYGHIVENIDRTMLGYELIKLLHKVTEDEPETAYFGLLEQAFLALDDQNVPVNLIRIWFSAQLLRLAGHSPNLQTSTDKTKLASTQRYDFDYDATAFSLSPSGVFGVNEVKFLRLLFGESKPNILVRVQGVDAIIILVAPLIQTLRQLHLRV